MHPFPTRDENGAAAVEMALVLPVLLLLVFGIVWFGIALNRSQGMHAAAREGARVASVGENYADILAKVQNAQNQVDPADVEIEVTLGPNGVDGAVGPGETPCTSSRLGTVVNVTARIKPDARTDYGFTIPLLPGSVDSDYSSSATFRCE